MSGGVSEWTAWTAARGGSLRPLTRRDAMTEITRLALATALLLAALLSTGCP
jgi:hypothetical protein